MAQTGYTPIKIYSTTTPSATPAAGNLEQGELAINITDGKLFYKDNANVVQVIATKNAAGATVTSVGGTGTVNGITLSGTVTSAGNLTLGGTLSNVSLSSQVTGTLPAANGGTGLTVPGTAGNILTSNGTGWVSQAPTTSGGTVTSVSGTGSVNGLTLSGTVTSSGNITLGGSLSNVSLTTQVAGILTVPNGGTGVSTFSAGFLKTGGGTAALTTASSISLTSDVSGTLPVASGGTGAITHTANAVLLGNGTAGFQSVAPGASGQILTSNGTTWVSQAPATGGGGTVTSVGFSTGSTGLTVSGSPVTTTGTFTLAGILNVSSGGTGATSLSGILKGNGTSAFSSATGSDIVSSIGATYVQNANYATTAGSASTATNAGNASTVTNGVYTTGNQVIGGIKQFVNTISGSIDGTAASANNATNLGGVAAASYAQLAGTQTFTGNKTFTGVITSSAYNFTATSSIYFNGFDTIFIALGGSNKFKVNTSGDMEITGANATKASGTTWINPSDRRLKDSIVDYTIGLAKIMQINPKSFVFNGKAGSTAGLASVGIIADDIEPVLPSTVKQRMVKLNPTDTQETAIRYFDASELTWVMVNAIKELKAEIDSLKAKLA